MGASCLNWRAQPPLWLFGVKPIDWKPADAIVETEIENYRHHSLVTTIDCNLCHDFNNDNLVVICHH
jgi:hypothetical protein